MKNLKRWSLLLVVIVAFMASCKPYHEKVYVEVEPNETAFVVPMEQDGKDGEKQKMFESIEYLEANKVAAKRIYTPTVWHKTGYFWTSGKWIPTVRVIKVDRTPVTREWTNDGSGSNSNKKEDIEVESKESIAFGVKVTATAFIPEDWAAKYRYYYNVRPLSEVMDKDVRGRIQNHLTTGFGKRSLTECQNSRSAVFDTMRADVIAYFVTRGVEITNLGAAGDFEYLDQDIQTAINEKYASEMKIEASQNEVDAANNFALAQRTITAQKHLDADIGFINACSDAMREGKFPVPETLVIGEDMTLMDVYGATKIGNR